MDQPLYRLTGVIRTKEELLEDFEGPLDVILLLLSKNKIEISDISITSILEQYLAYLDEMQRMDMEIASEFIIMASHLMQIKTKMLLSYSERTEAESEMDALRESLRQRQRAGVKEQLRGAIEALENGDEAVEEMRQAYDERRQLLVSGLNEVGLKTFEPKGAFYCFPDIRSTGLNSEQFAERLLYEEQVAAIPGTAFGECGEGYVRMAYTSSTNQIAKALERIARFVRRLR